MPRSVGTWATVPEARYQLLESSVEGYPVSRAPTRAAYTHPFPRRWFDMQSDSAVVIGDEFWDKIGGDGTWGRMLEVATEVGEVLKPRILNEYLLA